MNKELSKVDNSLLELQNTQKLCQMLLQSPHYKKIGADGIYAIVEMAKTVGADPMLCLNGGMFFVRGKVEMSALLMNTLIRQKGHSITKDKRSDNNICILHGKRADNGDTWVESYSVEDAKAANLLNSPTWKAYRKDMLFARALSRLARQLFPDLIRGAYVEGEIALDTAIKREPIQVEAALLGETGAAKLQEELDHHPDYRDNVHTYLARLNLPMDKMPMEDATKIFARLKKMSEESCEVVEVAHG